ncbi:uncharacterized protein LOC107010226 isoform X2 [Solanum pennellii]|uniref:Uncharacterized protein LOC107010226 isoform X2 n=1 Tax=Solanum pennellii TaxID=28526 RepID=A0ABM1G262_SOLPN|nr:uncharacterized protein LOC107010226 isoform X2 [Solanum pennellii]
MDTTLSVVEMQQLYNRFKPVLWVVRIKYIAENRHMETFGTAFSVSSDGLLLTTSHFFPKTFYELDVRRLDEPNFQSATVAYEKPKWDVLLLQLIDMNDCPYVGLNNNDSLSVGQILLHIGHPYNFVGSFLTGKIAFECKGNIEIPRTNLTCKSYTPSALETTPEYRIMGDIWNRHVFVDPRSFTYEKNLHPFVPVIQMCGFICGEGCSGGPVFNVRGEVVGMVAMSANGYEIAIHVAILRETLRLFKEQHSDDDENGKRKAIPHPKIQAGDSKKFKAHHVDRKGKGRLA